MPEKISELKLPHGLSRLAFRLPIWLYRSHLGWLLGTRVVLLTHIGRKSGLSRQTVLEVVRYEKDTGACIVASGWGSKSDWVQNVTADPNISFQIRNKRSEGIAQRLSPEAAAEELLNYSHRHPSALRGLAAFMGYRLDGTDQDIRALGSMIPMFQLKISSGRK